MNTTTDTKTGTVHLERTFNAPAHEVWKAWTETEKVKRWWGPHDYTCPVAKLDVRVGGTTLLAMADKEGKKIWSTATYTELEQGKRMVFLDRFSDANGEPMTPNEAGMPGDWPAEQKVTVTFQEKDGRTVMDLTHTGFPPEIVADCTTGWNESFDKLEAMLK